MCNNMCSSLNIPVEYPMQFHHVCNTNESKLREKEFQVKIIKIIKSANVDEMEVFIISSDLVVPQH